MKPHTRSPIYVTMDLGTPELCGTLWCEASRGKEIFSFEYEEHSITGDKMLIIDPGLHLHRGPQYAHGANFGIFLDSAPDRWGRFLIKRREVYQARQEERQIRVLKETDYLLGVHDAYRVGALRFQREKGGPFLDRDTQCAVPPWTSLRDLEFASMEIEKEDSSERAEYGRWLKMLLAPGGSLGGARPKASVVDENGSLWLAKFPGRTDHHDVGAWEMVVHELGVRCGLLLPEARVETFTSEHHTFLVKRFDRTAMGQRLFFMSAMTALSRSDGDDASSGVSYLHLADLLQRFGAHTTDDLHELWSRIAFHILVSNTDDHLRNHGFLIDTDGWRLSPAYDVNPNPEGDGLKLNISEEDNSQDLGLVLSVAKYFRLTPWQAEQRLRELHSTVHGWRSVARALQLSRNEIDALEPAFRLADGYNK